MSVRPRGLAPALLIITLGVTLRLIALNSRALAYDDTFSIFLAERSWGEIVRGTAADTMPPLYYFLLHLWMPLVGQTPFAMRFLGVCLGVLALPVVRNLAIRSFGPGAATTAIFLSAIGPFLIYHSQELRMYTSLALGLALYAYGTARWLGLSHRPERLLRRRASTSPRPRRWRWGAIVIAGATLALYSHNLALLTLAAPPLWLAWRRRWRDLATLAALLLAAACLFSPWLLFVPGQVAKIQRAFWTPRPTAVELIQLPVVWLTNLPLPDWLLPLALFVALATVTLAGYETARAARRCPADGRSYIVALIVLPVLLMFGLSYAMRPVFVPRVVIFGNLALAILLAGLLAPISRATVRIAALAPIVLVTIPALDYHYHYDGFPRSPYARLTAELRARARPGDLIVYDNKVAFFPAHFYDRALPQYYLADPPGSPNDTLAEESMAALHLFPIDRAAVAQAPAIWFVMFERDLLAAEGAGPAPSNLDWLDDRFRRTQEFATGDLRVIRFEAPNPGAPHFGDRSGTGRVPSRVLNATTARHSSRALLPVSSASHGWLLTGHKGRQVGPRALQIPGATVQSCEQGPGDGETTGLAHEPSSSLSRSRSGTGSTEEHR